MIKVMPKIYKGYSHINPSNPPLFDKYSGYWLCKYPQGGYLSYHTDVDADAGSVTVSYNINDDYEGGEVVFWKNHTHKQTGKTLFMFILVISYTHMKLILLQRAKDILLLFGLHIKKENNG